MTVFILFIAIKKFYLKNKIIVPKFAKFYLIYFIFLVISKYVANDNVLRMDVVLSHLIIVFSVVLLAIIIENSKFSEKFINFSSKLIVLLIVVAALVSIIQYFRPVFFVYVDKYTLIEKYSDEQGYARRIISIFSWGDVSNSQYMSFGLSSLYAIAIYEYRNNPYLKIILTFSMGVISFLSQMRVVMLTFVIAVIILFLRKISIKGIVLIIVFFSLTNFLISILDFDLNYFYENRMKSETAMTRIDAFRAFYYAFPERPWFGTGGERTESLYQGFGHKARMHNFHLGLAYYHGIFALIFHTLALFMLYKRYLFIGKRKGYWPPIIGIVCYVIATFTMPRGEFLEPGMILLMVYNKYYSDDYIKNLEERTN